MLKRDFMANRSFYTIVFTMIFSLLTLYLLFAHLSEPMTPTFSLLKDMYMFGLFVGTILFSGTAFRDMRTQGSAFQYLTLPASVEVKFLSKFILNVLGFFVVYTLLYFFFESVYLYVFKLITKAQLEDVFFNIFTQKPDLLFRWFGSFLFFSAVYFTGSAFFRKSNLLLTSVILFGFGVFLIILVLTMFYFIGVYDLLNELKDLITNDLAGNIAGGYNVNFNYSDLPKIWLFVIIGLLYLTAYFRLKELELK